MEYKPYLRSYLENAPRRGHGLRIRWAEAVGCHTTYMSQVLSKDAELSLEQGMRLTRELGHTASESHYFLLLVSCQRAGTPDLRAHFEKQIADFRDQQLSLRAKLADFEELHQIQQAKYYSAWYYGAAHMALRVEGLRSAAALSDALGLPRSRIEDVLTCLQSLDLISIDADGKIDPVVRSIHLDKHSEHVIRHHTNWRMQAIRAVEKESQDGFHYSSVVSLSEEDVPKVREILMAAIETIRGVIKDSGDEAVFSYLLDLFPVARSLKER